VRLAFSAAHVFDDISACFRNNVPVCINPGLGSTKFIPVRQGNTFISTKMPPSGDRRDDPLDIGMVEWTKDDGAEIAKTRRFLHLFQLDPNEPERAGNAYLVYGYPAAAAESLSEQQIVTYEP